MSGLIFICRVRITEVIYICVSQKKLFGLKLLCENIKKYILLTFMSRGSPHNSLSIRVSEWQVSIPWKSSESFAIVLISLIGFSILWSSIGTTPHMSNPSSVKVPVWIKEVSTLVSTFATTYLVETDAVHRTRNIDYSRVDTINILLLQSVQSVEFTNCHGRR